MTHAVNRPPLLELRDASVRYPGGTCGLRGVNLRIRQGSLLAVLGSNGSGKTTLIQLLAGLLKPASGEVYLRNQRLRKLAVDQYPGKVGVVFQNPDDQLFAPSVCEDVAVAPRNLGLDEAEVARRVHEALSACGAGALQHRPIDHLSFGEKKRVCIAGMLAMEPDVLLLDEPTAGLDPQGERQMLELVRQLKQQRGLTIVLATHAVDTVPDVADEVVLLAAGRLLGHGPTREMLTDQELLHRAGLRLPYVAELIRRLQSQRGMKDQPLPLTVGEAASLLQRQLALLAPGEAP